MIIARYEPDDWLTKKPLNLSQIKIYLFAPPVDDNPNFFAWVAQAIEDFQRALCAANSWYVEGKDEHDLV